MNFSKKNHSLSAPALPAGRFGVKLQISNKSFASKKLITTIVLLVFAFTMVDAQIKKSTKTKIPANNGFQQIEVKQKVDKDAILESDLFVLNSKAELVKIKKEKKALFSKIKNGNKRAEAKMSLLSLKEKNIKEGIKIDESYIRVARENFEIFIPKPLPPCPPILECGNGTLRDVLITKNIADLQIVVYDRRKNIIGYLEKKPYFIDKKREFRAHRFKITQKYSGFVLIKIKRINKKGAVENYQLSGKLK